MKAVSLFSSAGIGELRLKEIGIDVVCANEILKKRSDCYSYFFPKSKMVSGDIRDVEVKMALNECIKKEKPDLLMATPPCQGLSSLGKNKKQEEYVNDVRNYLIFDVFELIDAHNFKYILIENVPRYLKMLFPYKGDYHSLEWILRDKYSKKYKIKVNIFDAKDFGVPQTRPRSIIRMVKKSFEWDDPKKKKVISMREAIGHLPSLESGQKSEIKWHFAKKENDRYVKAMKHTPEGKSAMQNKKYYPVSQKGDKIKGFHNTFKRMQWDQPAHARTTYSYSISSHNNVHPGRLKKDGTYSDARVLTPLETMIVSSIPKNLTIPDWSSSNFIYTIIGEAIPPKLLREVLRPISK